MVFRKELDMEKAKVQMNMAMSIAEINNTTIERMDLQHCKMGSIDYYTLYVWYGDGKEIGIRSDCTIYKHN